VSTKPRPVRAVHENGGTPDIELAKARTPGFLAVRLGVLTGSHQASHKLIERRIVTVPVLARQPPYGVLGSVTWLTTASSTFCLSIVNWMFVAVMLAAIIGPGLAVTFPPGAEPKALPTHTDAWASNLSVPGPAH
jgi:hypothetical protein